MFTEQIQNLRLITEGARTTGLQKAWQSVTTEIIEAEKEIDQLEISAMSAVLMKKIAARKAALIKAQGKK